MGLGDCDVTSSNAMNRKGGTGGGGWVHPKGANSMAAFGFGLKCLLVDTPMN